MTPADIAASAFGGRVLRLIKARENEVYEVELPSGRAALRLHRTGYQSAAAIRSELWWCDALAAGGVPVPRPLRTLSGDMLAEAGGRFASAVGWLDGQPIGEAGVPLAGSTADQAALYRNLGRLLAQVHSVTDNLTLPAWFERPRWDFDGLLGEQPFWDRFWEHPALDPQEADIALRTRDFLRERIGGHAQRAPVRLIHADVLRENVFSGADGLSLIDFDDSGYGYALYDLGTALAQSLKEPALPAIAAGLAEGYGESQPIDAEMIPVFTLMRCCASVGWMIPRLQSGDPVIRRHIERMTTLAVPMLAGKMPW
ncbi:MAG: homoserine kinase [Cereibacter sphaeroides]|uniref:Homoserine kinase n=1 Tax=Cereibacter sphaeroides TaxID=1063 RepID=A0A2W5SCW4_CERSP|nr:MAG: homoserine kinase [Cereibacter sphaeroides]